MEQMKALSEDGWMPMVIWECEIEENPTRTLEKVQKMLQGQMLKIKGGT